MATEPDDPFYAHVTRELEHGRLTPFLGAGVNLVGIDTLADFMPGERLPSSNELAVHLAHEYRYPGAEGDIDLVRVAQWVFSRLGSETLYDYLHSIFDHDFPATPVHDVLAMMPEVVRRQAVPEYPLIITTNYDDALERAFAARDEAVDVLTYIASGRDRGRFRHQDPDGGNQVLKVPRKYLGVTLTERTVILKLHGAVRRPAVSPIDDDSYVVTEDDYMESLTRTDIVSFLPPAVTRRMQACHYLFLGYSLRDWNLRAMLHRIWRDKARHNHSWAVVTAPDPLEVEAWRSRSVDIFDLDLGRFSARLAQELADKARTGRAAG
jgi:hypothetical protein